MKKFLVVIFSFLVLTILCCCIFYNIGIGSVSRNSEEVTFFVDSGSTYYSIINKLKKENLIKNELCFKLYIKFNKVSDLQAGAYKLNRNMNVKEIVETFSLGNSYNPDAIVITFKEGINIDEISNIIVKNTNNTIDDINNLLVDQEYLNDLINNYWFIDESILNSNLYHSLEGYLYPNTYEFQNKDVTVKEIVKNMLDEMDKKLSEFKTDILNNKYSIHELLTLASIVELEERVNSDREGIAGVFYNRLDNGWSLGSDVTTYYASKVKIGERDLYKQELDDKNNYNTRSSYLAGKLPVGPICSPSIESIKAVLYPTASDYFYFVNDKNGKTYFSKNENEHLSIIKKLKEEGLWYTYD